MVCLDVGCDLDLDPGRDGNVQGFRLDCLGACIDALCISWAVCYGRCHPDPGGWARGSNQLVCGNDHGHLDLRCGRWIERQRRRLFCKSVWRDSGDRHRVCQYPRFRGLRHVPQLVRLDDHWSLGFRRRGCGQGPASRVVWACTGCEHRTWVYHRSNRVA